MTPINKLKHYQEITGFFNKKGLNKKYKVTLLECIDFENGHQEATIQLASYEKAENVEMVAKKLVVHCMPCTKSALVSFPLKYDTHVTINIWLIFQP